MSEIDYTKNTKQKLYNNLGKLITNLKDNGYNDYIRLISSIVDKPHNLYENLILMSIFEYDESNFCDLICYDNIDFREVLLYSVIKNDFSKIILHDDIQSDLDFVGLLLYIAIFNKYAVSVKIILEYDFNPNLIKTRIKKLIFNNDVVKKEYNEIYTLLIKANLDLITETQDQKQSKKQSKEKVEEKVEEKVGKNNLKKLREASSNVSSSLNSLLKNK